MGLKQRLRNISDHAAASIRFVDYQLRNGRRDETACRFVGSYGLMKSCDFWRTDGKPPAAGQLPKLAWDRDRPPAIYVKTDHLPAFAETSLEQISDSFILVSGCSDTEIGPRGVDAETQRRLLEHPWLQNWFAQNCNTDHPKLRRLPIGLDYHTITFRVRHKPWGLFSTPVMQEAALDRARQEGPRLDKKSVSGYCNWHHVLDRGDRLRCMNSVELDVLRLERLNINRTLSWHNNVRHLFTLSPLGNGFDCHRTWEAILLGTVPIVPRSGITSLFTGLPVCIVDDWAEVTVDYLERKREWALDSEFDFAPLYLDWWKATIRNEGPLPARKQSFQDFVDTADQPLSQLGTNLANAA
ncbi:hypothetical protein [Nitratireductor sp. XY-223]|uniref:hypothetical protein n=1 Tax=Nitratireductor sp. XY-223 TaxID=2561926 RepID=UPI0010A9D084|nr:hypothetical protein [Nitratireductor sp. XY-223]